MKKSSLNLIFASVVFLVLVFSVVNVSAASGSSIPELLSSVATGIRDTLGPVATVIVGDTKGGVPGAKDYGEIFYGKLLMLLVVFTVVYVLLYSTETTGEFFKDSSWAPWVISSALAIVSVRFLDAQWVNAVILPNQVFAIVLTAGLPFVLFFLVVRKFPPTATRIAWVFFGVVFLLLYASRSSEPNIGTAINVYPLTALGALIMIIFDGTWRKWLTKMEMERAHGHAANLKVAQIEADIVKLEEQLRIPNLSPSVKKSVEDRIEELKKISMKLQLRKYGG